MVLKEAHISLLEMAGVSTELPLVSFLTDNEDAYNEEIYWHTEYLLTIATAASLGALATAASLLDSIRYQRAPKEYHIDLKHAAAFLNSHKYSKADGHQIGKLWDDYSGFYQCADKRWIQLHCNFPHHKENVFKALQCSKESKTCLEQKFSENSALFWETKLSDSACCVSFVRTLQEWKLHEQYDVISSLPLFEIIKIGESPPEIARHNGDHEYSLPLSNIRVLDFTRVLAGPVGCKLLAQLGADVLKVTSPHLPFVEALVPDTNIGKRTTHLNISEIEDKDTLFDLIKQSDVFFQAYRPGSLGDKGFCPNKVASVRPGIIYVSLSAYSHRGPWSQKRGFDSLVQSSTGIVSEQTTWEKQSNGEQTLSHWPVSAQDYVCGILASYATVIALRRRATEGGSYHVRLSLAQTGQWISSLGRSSKSPPQSVGEKDLRDYFSYMDTHWGNLQYVKPIFFHPNLRAPSPLGTHPPSW